VDSIHKLSMYTLALVVLVLTFFWEQRIVRGQVTDVGMQPLSDVFTFSFAFGDKDLPGEYLIASRSIRWNAFTVDDSNNYYLFDEKCIKVYDSKGKAKAILGRPGEGPEEFGRGPGLVTASPAGYITACNDQVDHKFYNVFSPEYKFINTVFESTFEVGTQYPCKVVALNENEFVRELTESRLEEGILFHTFSLEYSMNGEATILISYDVPTHIATERSRMSLPYLGDLFWFILPGRKVACTHTRWDEEHTTNGNYYLIHLIDLDSNNKQVIRQPFKLIPIPESLRKGGFTFSGSKYEREIIESRRNDYLEKNPVENYPGLQFVYCDGLTIFALTREMRESEEGNPEYVAHVIDSEKGNILSNFK